MLQLLAIGAALAALVHSLRLRSYPLFSAYLFASIVLSFLPAMVSPQLYPVAWRYTVGVMILLRIAVSYEAARCVIRRFPSHGIYPFLIIGISAGVILSVCGSFGFAACQVLFQTAPVKWMLAVRMKSSFGFAAMLSAIQIMYFYRGTASRNNRIHVWWVIGYLTALGGLDAARVYLPVRWNEAGSVLDVTALLLWCLLMRPHGEQVPARPAPDPEGFRRRLDDVNKSMKIKPWRAGGQFHW